MEENPSNTEFCYFQNNKRPAVPYFFLFKNKRPQEHLIFAFSQLYKTTAIPFFSILNILKPQPGFILAYSAE